MNQSHRLVSVVMPVYNAMPYLAPAVRAILTQTWSDFEFVIVNDGSTDASRELLTQAATGDPRIRFYSHDRTDLAAVRNELVQRAQGELLVWADADDISEPDRVQRQVEYMQQHPACVCLGAAAICIDRSGRPFRRLSPPLCHAEIDAQHLSGQGGGVLNPTACMRRSAVVQLGGFRSPFPPSEDYDLLLRLAEVGKLANLPQVLVRYRMHRTSASFVRSQEMVQHARQALEEACQRRGLAAPPASEAAEKTSWRTEDPDLLFACWANRDGYASSARYFGYRAVLHEPSDRRCWTELALACFPAPPDSTGRVTAARLVRGLGRRVIGWSGVPIGAALALAKWIGQRIAGSVPGSASRSV